MTCPKCNTKKRIENGTIVCDCSCYPTGPQRDLEGRLHGPAEFVVDNLWIERYSELLECDVRPAAVANKIQKLIGDLNTQRKTIAELRKRSR